MSWTCSIRADEGRWHKAGRIFAPAGSGWMLSHAQNPLPDVLVDGRVRVHFASRDARNRSRGGMFECDLSRPVPIDVVSVTPTLDLGDLGAFDDAGVMPSSLVDWRGDTHLYYTGWSRTVDVPFAFHIGVAVSRDGGRTFHRRSRAPVLGRTTHDPFITGAPCVCVEDRRLRMWYVSALRWEHRHDGPPRHYYTVKHADSADGLRWRTTDAVCLPLEPGEYAIARPVVWRAGGVYQMWFSCRSERQTYRVGTAVSGDGLRWERRAAPIGLDVSEAGWDAEMLCYAHPFECRGRTYALYNGSGYGRDGVGLAEWRPA